MSTFHLSPICCRVISTGQSGIFLKFSINKASRRLYCPVCGRPMSMNLRMDHTFVEDEGWHQAAERYSEFLEQHKRQKTLFLDLGTGMNTPGDHKISFLENDGGKSAGNVCLYQQRGSLLSKRHRETVNLY